MSIILTAPSSPPVSETQWRGMGVTWEAAGKLFDLTSKDGGIVLVRDGVEGLHFPEIVQHTSRHRATHGQRSRGFRVEPREAFWKVYIWGDGGDAWLSVQDEFWSTIRPDVEGVWRVTAGGQSRTVRLRGQFDDSFSYERDPLLHGWAVFPVKLVADQPFWTGPLVQSPVWRAADPLEFFPAGGGPSFHISSASTFGTARIGNPGDVGAYPRWEIRDQLGDIQVGVGADIITVPFDMVTGDRLTIYSDPRAPRAVLNGTAVTRTLGLQDFAPIPPGGAVDVHVSATGNGSVQATLEPLHYRALGAPA